ncbi:hypothetical protein SEA_YELLOWPANDA_19 [Microbacterium phage YellowPanda]|uniref:Uncharacterized protein n=2 Tax=Tinytimothyvirus tinytimothy TaxID=2845596 RepID=A0A5Q2WM76_9CAUD|nr:hypothetical protein HWC33_gp18 [Microbacterium phage TinyTimothy]QDF16971.1 hypothetical protein SEA_TINYTIMOTHY_18 [Microbacterium phage TinyTimothy]QGH78659.1 hypothetical protein SEA_WESAK_18 [Microbacterium phage Wesak]
MRLIISTTSRQQTKMARARDRRRAAREHKQHHLNIAEAMRAEAKRIQDIMDREPDMPESAIEEGKAIVLKLNIDAIAEENSSCMDEH